MALHCQGPEESHKGSIEPKAVAGVPLSLQRRELLHPASLMTVRLLDWLTTRGIVDIRVRLEVLWSDGFLNLLADSESRLCVFLAVAFPPEHGGRQQVATTLLWRHGGCPLWYRLGPCTSVRL